jgi:EAL domain-containing protein (putative c-di-GMP-specific phosphodiesterase class I)
MRERSRAFLEMASDLRMAIGRRQLRVEYQPIVSLPSGDLCALEALARWSHPRRGHVSPADFIPVAERAGLISEIGDWVFHEAVDSAVRWCEMVGEGCPRVSVNVSAHQLRDADFVYTIARGLEHYDLPFDRLQLEVTESAVIENIDAAVESLRVLSGLGVKIAIDDFGSGNSSLWLLKELSWVDVLKVDKGFVTGLCDSPANRAIVKAVIDVASALGMSVVAEGVEIEPEADALARLECEQAQGWHFGRPLRPTAADAAVVAASHQIRA